MMSIISMILNFAGSLCVLLFGMKLLSDGIQKSTGQRLQNALSFMTKNRFFGLLTVFKRFKKEGIGHAIMGEKGANVKAELLYIDIVRKVEKMGNSCYAIARQLSGTI